MYVVLLTTIYLINSFSFNFFNDKLLSQLTLAMNIKCWLVVTSIVIRYAAYRQNFYLVILYFSNLVSSTRFLVIDTLVESRRNVF